MSLDLLISVLLEGKKSSPTALIMLVYIIVPELRNVPGRNLVGLAFSLAMAFIILVTIRVGWIRMGKTECFATGESYLSEFP